MNESVDYQSDKRGNWISSIIYVVYTHEMFKYLQISFTINQFIEIFEYSSKFSKSIYQHSTPTDEHVEASIHIQFVA